MKAFQQLNYPTFPTLFDELETIRDHYGLRDRDGQISITTNLPNSTDTRAGTGSLFYDWDNVTHDLEGALVVPHLRNPLNEADFRFICQQFKHTSFDELVEMLRADYRIGRVRIMIMKPRSTLTWHVDDTDRIHYPMMTQEGCFMVIEDEVKHLEQDKWYLTNTKHRFHTAVNASKSYRMHLVASVIS